MTSIWLISDLHMETSTFQLPPVPHGAKVLVVAGDVSEDVVMSIETVARWQESTRLPVIFVPGNHDFYGRDIDNFEMQQRNGSLSDFAEYGLYVLHSGQTAVIAGTRFVGATLWTDFAIAGDIMKAGYWFNQQMPDRAAIDIGLKRISARDLRREHQRQLTAIENVLQVPFDGPTVVVTHHAPHPKSLRNPQQPDVMDGSFGSDLTSTIMRYRPNAWLHGHVHQSYDYMIGDTWVVCNPRGYLTPRHNGNPEFDPGLVLYVS
ncbi:metallophosphoesterase [Devosia sp. A449]